MTLPESFNSQLFRQLELQQLKARKAFLGLRQGAHYSPKRGHGIEFAEFRKYEIGDDLRHIDWNLVARSERFYIKKFREEQDLLVHLILDNSESMFAPDPTKWQRVMELALAIGYLASMQQDRVQLAVPGVLTAKKYSGKNLIYKLADDLQKIKPQSANDYWSNLKVISAATNFPGIAYYVSDFLDEPDKIKDHLQSLLARNLDLRVIQVLTPEELHPVIGSRMIAVDSETNQEVALQLNSQQVAEYQAELAKHHKNLQDFAWQRQVSWHACQSNENFPEVCKRILGAEK